MSHSQDSPSRTTARGKDDGNFYRAFEDRHRGSRTLIKERLRVYLPFIDPFKKIGLPCTVLDLGCGRGEWLELVQEAGFESRGIDLDDGMLAACRSRNLNVTTQDAVEALRAAPDESLCVVSGFHIAEHLSFETLQHVVRQALRALKPAGLLILETPNPENLIVGTSNFYLDPTHQKPLPPQLLAFLPEHAGFSRVKVLRLQEPHELHSAEDLHLMHVFAGTSPDYAIVAQKAGPEHQLEVFDNAFSREHGLTLGTLAERYETLLRSREAKFQTRVEQEFAVLRRDIQDNLDIRAQQRDMLAMLQDTLAHERARAESLATELAQAHAERQALADRMHRVEQSANAARISAERQATAYRDQLQAVYASSCWRITWPLRQCTTAVKGSARLAKRIGKSLVLKGMRPALRHPAARAATLKVLDHMPGLRARMRAIALNNGLLRPADTATGSPTAPATPPGAPQSTTPVAASGPVPTDLSMTESARTIHAQLLQRRSVTR